MPDTSDRPLPRWQRTHGLLLGPADGWVWTAKENVLRALLPIPDKAAQARVSRALSPLFELTPVKAVSLEGDVLVIELRPGAKLTEQRDVLSAASDLLKTAGLEGGPHCFRCGSQDAKARLLNEEVGAYCCDACDKLIQKGLDGGMGTAFSLSGLIGAALLIFMLSALTCAMAFKLRPPLYLAAAVPVVALAMGFVGSMVGTRLLQEIRVLPQMVAVGILGALAGLAGGVYATLPDFSPAWVWAAAAVLSTAAAMLGAYLGMRRSMRRWRKRERKKA